MMPSNMYFLMDPIISMIFNSIQLFNRTQNNDDNNTLIYLI